MSVFDAQRDEGFTTLEALAAVLIGLCVLVAGAGAFETQVSLAHVQPATADLLDRVRTAVSVIRTDLSLAGGGVPAGLGSGSLIRVFPPIHPRRLGLRGSDASSTARSDVVTLVFASSVGGGRLSAPIAGASSPLALDGAPPCSAAAWCGFAEGDTVVAFDRTGQHDFYRVDAAAGALPVLVARQPSASSAYAAGTQVLAVETHTYYFDSFSRQLRHYDGYLSDTPVADNVAAMSISYWGEDRPPALPKPPVGTANCLYDETGAPLPWAGAPLGLADPLVPVPLVAFADGPWCGTGDNRFDADQLRIRRVRLVVTLQAPDDVRASGTLFLHPGASRSARRLVPDVVVSIDVTPRNLNAGR